MLYRIHVTVLRADKPGGRSAAKDWHDAVSCIFGVNADNTGEAVEIAVAAAGNAVDRNGEFIGGVVIEAAGRCVDRKEFDGHEKYFHRAIGDRGIFYVSGVRRFRLSGFGNSEAIESLKKLNRKIRAGGLPEASFVHPRLPDEPPERMRLLCSVCKRWVEVESDEVLGVFMASPLDEFKPGEKAIWRSIDVVGPFVRRHAMQCLFTTGEPRGAMLAIHEPDPRWDTLDPDKREDDPGERGVRN